MGVNPGDRVVYVAEPLWMGPDPDDWIRPGHRGTVVDLEPPDDAPIVTFDNAGALVVRQEDVRLAD